MSSSRRLENKVAVVTGGASGIGLAIVERLHEEGARIVIADISGEEKTVANRLGARVVDVNADVTVAADIRRMLQVACDRFGGLDILCNNAGIAGSLDSIADYDEDAYERLMAINLRGVFLGMKYAIPLMIQRGGGAIVNTSSLASLIASPGLGVYGAAKAGINALTRSAAAEYAQHKIRVNAVCPAAVLTPLVAKLFETNPAASAAAVAMIPSKRAAQPAEIADVVLFFASDESSFVTGVSIPVDGGYSVV